jgi:hypothetical protein
VLHKTIPLFCVPAHTVTFLLPAALQTLFAALPGIVRGLPAMAALRSPKARSDFFISIRSAFTGGAGCKDACAALFICGTQVRHGIGQHPCVRYLMVSVPALPLFFAVNTHVLYD